MSDLVVILVLGGVSLVAAWFVNFLVGLFRGEHPGDTGRVWWGILTGMLAVLEIGWVARALTYCTGTWPRRIITTIGACALLVFIVQACPGE